MKLLDSMDAHLNPLSLIVRGIPQHLSQQDIVTCLRRNVCPPRVGDITIPLDRGASLGIAYLNFKSANDATAALRTWRWKLLVGGTEVALTRSARAGAFGPEGRKLCVQAQRAPSGAAPAQWTRDDRRAVCEYFEGLLHPGAGEVYDVEPNGTVRFTTGLAAQLAAKRAAAEYVLSDSGSSSGSGSGSPPPPPRRGPGPDQDPDPEDPVFALLRCPLTGVLFEDPVVAADGHTYDRAAIALWFATSDLSPVFGMYVPHKLLTPNHVVARMLALIRQ